jgi:hypothetical protein
VRKSVARSLSRLSRRQRGLATDRSRIEAAIHRELGSARLALASLKKLSISAPLHGQAPRTPAELLAMTLLEERDARILQALLLLEVLYPDVRLDVVAENLRSETAAVRGNAIEVLDNTLPEPWKRLVMAALDEVKRRGDVVVADSRDAATLVCALVGGESSPWVGACAARWMLDARLPANRLAGAIESALRSPAPALREAAAFAAARMMAGEAPRLLASLVSDPAASVRRSVTQLLRQGSARASA